MIRIARSIVVSTWLAAAAVAGAAELEGSITDAGGLALPGANITVTGAGGLVTGDFGAVSGESGNYVVPGLAAGSYDVRITHIGFRTSTSTGVRVDASGATLNITLERVLLDLEMSVVSASRIQEKALDAPAAIAIVEGQKIEDRAALSVSEYISDQPGVDFAKTGLVQSNVVVRGFNNIFSGAMLVLTDNRIANVPSLRLNAFNFIPTSGADLERIEVVLGPGAALYGPNSANGVMHLITRSPFTSTGTNVQFGLGERSLVRGLVRHAAQINSQLALKLSAQYFTGRDWEGYDRGESTFAAASPSGRTETGFEVITGRDTTLSTLRNFDIARRSAEFRLDYRPTDDLTAIVAIGHNQSENIELTGIGAGRTEDWTYNYLQTRILYGDWFAQYYRNMSDAGTTTIYRTGNPIVDESTLDVFQLQHSAYLGARQRFTYGIDGLFTRPQTGGTITGENEEFDDLNELGAYLQSDTQIKPNLDLVLALRYDTHNRLDDAAISPRAALLYKPTDTQSFRLTFNRAFSTPTTNNLYLDIEVAEDAYGLGAFESSLGFSPAVDIRSQGTYRKGFDEGFSFRRGAEGRPLYRSSFAPAIQGQAAALGLTLGSPGYPLDTDGYIALDDPLATNVQWNIGAGVTLQQLGPALAPLASGLIAQQLIAAGVESATAQAQGQETAAAVIAALPAFVPSQLGGLTNTLAEFNPQTWGFDPVADAIDVPRSTSTLTQTIEVGYKGIVNKNLVIAANLYHSSIEDFGGPLQVETPNVFLDPVTLGKALGPAFQAALDAPENAAVSSVLNALDAVDVPGVVAGNNNGTAADELTTIFVGGAARIPYGTVSPEQAYNPTAVLVTYRNFGNVTLYGFDLSLGYYPTDQWSITGNYSFVSDDFWEDLGGPDLDVVLNATKQKFNLGTSYDLAHLGLRVGGKARYNGGFPMNSGVYVGDVDSYTVLDLQARYELPFDGLYLLVNVDNFLDSGYQAFVGAPEVGRLAYAQVGIDF